MFSSKTDPIPPLRYDIQVIEVAQDGQDYLLFQDMLGYATEGFAIPAEMEPILSLIDGSRSVQQLMPFVGEGATEEELLQYIQFLDQHRLLDSDFFAKSAEETEDRYEASSIHHSNTAGGSYPDSPAELKSQLDEAFAKYETSEPVSEAAALYAPHIDPRVGMQSYVKAFSAIRNLKPNRVIMLGTSHYAGLYGDLYDNTPFIVSEKTFRLPNGEVRADSAFIHLMKNSLNSETHGVSFSDRAHRIEHSLELHLLYLNHIWDHDFEIVPILVGGMEDLLYMNNSHKEQQVNSFMEWIAAKTNNETIILISGDLAHFGRKFGDNTPASDMFESVKAFDHTFLKLGADAKDFDLLEHIREDLDPYRVCGFPPLYSFLKTGLTDKGTILSYDLWDERERNSAVTFGSILYK
ncbi:AmmeMemoRadiSam system protein B [Balneola sp. MJW-20]|uniref:AmmeMemoRadiSam system protein B n=1 Tax=Gracilimonas aurantiaca TaxID=3234185 RepID=UPI003466C62E